MIFLYLNNPTKTNDIWGIIKALNNNHYFRLWKPLNYFLLFSTRIMGTFIFEKSKNQGTSFFCGDRVPNTSPSTLATCSLNWTLFVWAEVIILFNLMGGYGQDCLFSKLRQLHKFYYVRKDSNKDRNYIYTKGLIDSQID